MNRTTRVLVFANITGLAAVLVFNYLSVALPLNGKTPGQLSDQYPNLFTPAGLTFSIWGFIYLGLITWVGCQVAALMNQKLALKIAPMLEKIGWLFAYSCFLNIAWLLAWHWEKLLVSVVIMANLLYILTQLNQAAGVGTNKTSRLEKWLEHLPFGIYQGWITVAIIANITAWLTDFGWSGGGLAESTWAITMAAIGASLAIFMLYRQNNVGHGLAVSWALYGIYRKQIESSGVDSTTVAWAALGLACAVLLAVVWRWRKWMAY